jgi:protein-tyrosine phosphatase
MLNFIISNHINLKKNKSYLKINIMVYISRFLAFKGHPPLEPTSTPAKPKGLTAIAPTRQVAKRLFSDPVRAFFKGITTSRIIQHLIIATGIALAIYFLVTPPGWCMLGIGALSGIAGGLCFLAISVSRLFFERKLFEVQPFEVEIKNLYRRGVEMNEIKVSGTENKIYLGTIPNSFFNDLDKLKKLYVKTIISVNHPQERGQIGFFHIPYSEQSYKEENMVLRTIDVSDHCLLTNQQMQAADKAIAEAISIGNVYIHCQAGKGRSAQALAAYLINTKKIKVEAAIKCIFDSRSQSTIRNKKDALESYQNFVLST